MERKIVVEAKGLSKRFDDHQVIKGIHFEVNQGECFGILGPDGSGKSTLMKMMYGAFALNGGELFISGLNLRENLREIKARIGVLTQDDGFEESFTVRENLSVFGSYFGIPGEGLIRRTEELLKLVRLEDLGDQLVAYLDVGMKRRLAMAQALIHSPEILILDEPSSRMDAAGRSWMWDFLKKIKDQMGTVILTTRYMEEAEKVCDRIAILDRGEILAIGEPQNLIRDLIGWQVIDFVLKPTDIKYYLSRLSSQKFRYQVLDDQVQVHLQTPEDTQKALSLVQSMRVTIRQPTLSDVFLKLAGHRLREEPL